MTAAELASARRDKQVEYARYFKPVEERKRSRSDAATLAKRPRTNDAIPGASVTTTSSPTAGVNGTSPSTSAPDAAVNVTSAVDPEPGPEPESEIHTPIGDAEPLAGAPTPP